MVRIFLKSNSLVIAECRKFMPHNVWLKKLNKGMLLTQKLKWKHHS
jgi:hypothetical protein